MNALKQVLALVINVVAACFFAGSGHVIWSLVAVMAPASLLGGLAGGKLVTRIKPSLLRGAVVTYGTVWRSTTCCVRAHGSKLDRTGDRQHQDADQERSLGQLVQQPAAAEQTDEDGGEQRRVEGQCGAGEERPPPDHWPRARYTGTLAMLTAK